VVIVAIVCGLVMLKIPLEGQRLSSPAYDPPGLPRE
jgi:hypothetical protein